MVQTIPIILVPGFLTDRTHKTKALHNLEHRVLGPSCALQVMSNSLGIVGLKVIILFGFITTVSSSSQPFFKTFTFPSPPSSASCVPQEDLAGV